VALEQGHGILSRKLLGVLGDASYSLYLSHFFTLSLVKFVWLRFALQSPYVFLAVGVVTSLVVGIALYQWVERPMLERMLRGAARQSVKRLPAAAAE
jgi:peptidoglycan/LPS O-acetylase OafA/YrhL